MEKISFQDYPSTDTPINSTNLNDLQDNVENEINTATEKNAITVKMSGGTSFDWHTETTVPFDTVLTKVGDKLSLVSNKIEIGTGIDTVIVSASLAGYTGQTYTGNGYIKFSIKKNGIIIGSCRTELATRRPSATTPDLLISVQEGDLIETIIYASTSFTSSIDNDLTFLTVRAL